MKPEYVSHEEIRQLAYEFRHLKEEHEAHSAEAVRRRLAEEMAEIQRRFERTLAHLIPDEADRQAWRAFFYHGAEEPSRPAEISRRVIYRGRSGLGSIVEVREHPPDGYDVSVDGAVVRRLSRPVDQPVFRLNDVEYREIFQAPPEALAALLAYTRDPEREPPWRYAPQLIEDGLIDRNLSLFPRGHRALATFGAAAGAEAARV